MIFRMVEPPAPQGRIDCRNVERPSPSKEPNVHIDVGYCRKEERERGELRKGGYCRIEKYVELRPSLLGDGLPEYIGRSIANV